MLNVKKTLSKILTAINAPIIFKVASRSITQSAGSKDYWTLTDHMEAKTGYTRVPIAYGTSNGALAVLCTRMNGDAVEVQTFNYAGSQTTATIICLYIWIRDDLFGGGYFLKVFSRLAERRWEYAERKETPHKYATETENRARAASTSSKTALGISDFKLDVDGDTYRNTLSWVYGNVKKLCDDILERSVNRGRFTSIKFDTSWNDSKCSCKSRGHYQRDRINKHILAFIRYGSRSLGLGFKSAISNLYREGVATC